MNLNLTCEGKQTKKSLFLLQPKTGFNDAGVLAYISLLANVLRASKAHWVTRCLCGWTHRALRVPSTCNSTNRQRERDKMLAIDATCHKCTATKFTALKCVQSVTQLESQREPECHSVDWLRTGEAALIILSDYRRTGRQKSESLRLLPSGKISVSLQVSQVSPGLPHTPSFRAAASCSSGMQAVPFKNSCC